MHKLYLILSFDRDNNKTGSTLLKRFGRNEPYHPNFVFKYGNQYLPQ